LFDQNRAGRIAGLALAFLAVVATACAWSGISIKDLIAMVPRIR
jgi:hypothetical protein